MIAELKALFDYYEKERGIDRGKMVEALPQALLAASKKSIGPARELRIDIDPDKGNIKVFAKLLAVETVTNPWEEIPIAKAKKLKKDALIGDEIEIEVTPNNMGRIAAQTAKQTMLQRLRMAEKEKLYDEFKDRTGNVVSGVLRRFEKPDVVVDLGKFEGVMTSKERVSAEDYPRSDRIFVCVNVVEKDSDQRLEIISSCECSSFERKASNLERDAPTLIVGCNTGFPPRVSTRSCKGKEVNLATSQSEEAENTSTNSKVILVVNQTDPEVGHTRFLPTVKVDATSSARDGYITIYSAEYRTEIKAGVENLFFSSKEGLMNPGFTQLSGSYVDEFLYNLASLRWKSLAKWMIYDAFEESTSVFDASATAVNRAFNDRAPNIKTGFLNIVEDLLEDRNLGRFNAHHFELIKMACLIARECMSSHSVDQPAKDHKMMSYHINWFAESANRWFSSNRLRPSKHCFDHISACSLPLRLALHTTSGVGKTRAVLQKTAAAEDTSCHLFRSHTAEIAFINTSPQSSTLEWSFASCMHEAFHICFAYAAEEQNMKWINNMPDVSKERLEETSVHALTQFVCGMSDVESLFYCKLVAQRFADSLKVRRENLLGFIVNFSELALRLHVAREFADRDAHEVKRTDNRDSFESFHSVLWDASIKFLPDHLAATISRKGTEVVRQAAQEHALERCDELSSSIDRHAILMSILWFFDYLPHLNSDHIQGVDLALRARQEVRRCHQAIAEINMLPKTYPDHWKERAAASLTASYSTDALGHGGAKKKLLLVACLLGCVLSHAKRQKRQNRPNRQSADEQVYWDILDMIEGMHNRDEVAQHASRYLKQCGASEMPSHRSALCKLDHIMPFPRRYEPTFERANNIMSYISNIVASKG